MVITKTTDNKIVQCCLIGDGLVGKSHLARSFLRTELPIQYRATIFGNYTGKLNLFNEAYTVGLFDTAGQQDNDRLRIFTYRHSDVIVVCFSMVDRESFLNVKEFWVPEVKRYGRSKTSLILLGTQSDRTNNVVDTDHHVQIEEGQKLAKEIGADTFLTCSAFDRDSIIRTFECVVNSGIKQRKHKLSIIKKIWRKWT